MIVGGVDAWVVPVETPWRQADKDDLDWRNTACQAPAGISPRGAVKTVLSAGKD